MKVDDDVRLDRGSPNNWGITGFFGSIFGDPKNWKRGEGVRILDSSQLVLLSAVDELAVRRHLGICSCWMGLKIIVPTPGCEL